MKSRLASAAVGIPVLLLAVYLGVSAIGVLAILAALAGGFEIAGMAAPPIGQRNVFVMATAPALAGTGLAAAFDSELWWLVAAALIAGVVPSAIVEAVRLTRSALSYTGVLAAAALGLLLAHGPLLRSLDDHGYWLLLAILTTFAVDSAAFVVGRTLGRTPFAPRLSPSKTWEGAAAGVAAGIGAAIGLAAVFDLGPDPGMAALIGAALAAAAIAGDLLESAFKRQAGVKDSGGLIPGHGGLLDRLDSLAPNLAIVYWFAIWLTP